MSRVTIQLYMSGNRSKNSWTCLFWENINGSLFFPQRYTAHFLHDMENDWQPTGFSFAQKNGAPKNMKTSPKIISLIMVLYPSLKKLGFFFGFPTVKTTSSSEFSPVILVPRLAVPSGSRSLRGTLDSLWITL